MIFLLLSLVLGGSVLRLLYRKWLHPLAHFPGPASAAVSNLPYVKWVISGQLHQRLRELHDEYGDVVRIRPNSLVYRSSQAWKDIYGHRKGGALPFIKDPEFFTPAPPGHAHLINANEADHARQRRLLSHAFSDRVMRDQEPLIMSHVNTFIQKLKDKAREGEVIDMTDWLNFLTFDIVGDLAFGEPFGCLKDSAYHPWVGTIFNSIKTGAILRAFAVYPHLANSMRHLMPKRLTEKRRAHYQMSKEKMLRRLSIQTQRPDFVSYILRYNEDDERCMSRSEIEMNAAIIIQAGSETSASVLCSCIYLLLQRPECLERAVNEIRSTFIHDSDITFTASSKLDYVSAVIEESLRLFPAIPAILPRLVPDGGATINGEFVPAHTSVSVAHYSAYRGSENFTDPDTFAPERWLDSAPKEFTPYQSDQHDVFQPFSYGPRGCIGQNLAYAEMRNILAKLLWHFDITQDFVSPQWVNPKSYIVWAKRPLHVRLEER
ncbi:hypothetical protein N7509_014068 [Penicillium cosmopolitanum]|uniref:Cytochrome P450 n=1 Tax=Penicillium cosmopolitanum TaxID=1131564 RepID=A0A9W9S039_9EURO|nr:uncharacterized protein N7509_014068 [Penicillium cosmopolitanum]KAJ5369456.1 hypothetical protein N7509_014068 [Penicillium cosmopolitanum]